MKHLQSILFVLVLVFGTALATEAAANSYRVRPSYGYGYQNPGVRNPYYYSDPYSNNNVVIIQQRGPVLLERTGSNDQFYTYDNVYGAEASAAGRMSRIVNNPQPQLFYAY